MRILFDHFLPFQLAHGGLQVQIQETLLALCRIGIKAEFLQWWNEEQKPDLIHYFGVPNWGYLDAANRKGVPVVATVLLSETCNRPQWRLRFQKLIVRSVLKVPFGGTVKTQLTWPAYRRLSAIFVGLDAERRVLNSVYGVAPDRIHQVPLGLADEFFRSRPAERGYGPLLCIGTITPQKKTVELARLAHEAKVPVQFVGRPYREDEYWREFQSLVDGVSVIHTPFVKEPRELCDLLDRSRGAVITSDFENWSLAAHEAAARGLPLLLRPQNWAKERFGRTAEYFSRWGRKEAVIELRKFYEQAPNLPSPSVALARWTDTAKTLQNVYSRVLRREVSDGKER